MERQAKLRVMSCLFVAAPAANRSLLSNCCIQQATRRAGASLTFHGHSTASRSYMQMVFLAGSKKIYGGRVENCHKRAVFFVVCNRI